MAKNDDVLAAAELNFDDRPRPVTGPPETRIGLLAPDEIGIEIVEDGPRAFNPAFEPELAPPLPLPLPLLLLPGIQIPLLLELVLLLLLLLLLLLPVRLLVAEVRLLTLQLGERFDGLFLTGNEVTVEAMLFALELNVVLGLLIEGDSVLAA